MSITEVARQAGVSTSTVSRVINKYPRVAPQTAKTVRQAMRKLRYVPSERRPGPKTGSRVRSSVANIALLVMGASESAGTPAFEALVRGVSNAAAEQRFNLSLLHMASLDELPPQFVDGHIAAVLLHGAIPSGSARQRLGQMPAVWLMGNHRRPDFGDQVMPDPLEVGNMAARYLVQRGHKHLAFLNLDSEHWPFRLRYQAFCASAEELGATVVRLEMPATNKNDYWFKYTPEAAEKMAADFLALSPRPGGVLVADDIQTAMLQPALERLGAAPAAGRLDIVSCNNEQPYLLGLRPRPAVIDVRAATVGAQGVSRLMWRLAHPEVTERIITLIEPALIPAE